ncbi:MAG: transglycosylase SLT domain-containing protein [Thermodesulfovibrionales bacterium]
MRRLKSFHLVFLALALVLILPVLSYAEDKANDEILLASSSPVQDEKALEKVPEKTSSPSAFHSSAYDTNGAASKAVEKNVGFFTTRIRDKFSLWLSRSGQYLDLMKGILRKKDVPEDIVFLSLIESGFNPNAYSIAKAVGPWQFISSTAKRYGLQINWWKDERRDPVKSTTAAADYLKDLYGMFGSWNFAMAAYNAGEGKILRAIKKSRADDYWDLLDTKHIRNETKEYVPKFIAASIIARNPEDFGFLDIEYNEPLSYDEVELDSPVDLAVVAECADTELEVIKKLNPELRRWCTPPDVAKYMLKIPQGTKDTFLEKLSAVPEEERFTIDRYTVKKSDTFKKIARMTGVPESVILSLNSMEKIMPLKVGSKIYLPPKGLYTVDADDRSSLKKVSHKHKKKKTSAKRSSRHGKKV